MILYMFLPQLVNPPKDVLFLKKIIIIFCYVFV